MRQHLSDPVEGEQFIDGIFKYCDRWCERCPFTSRCRNYAMLADFSGPVAGDPDTTEFWGRIGDALIRTKELLRGIGSSLGIDHDADRIREDVPLERPTNDYGLPNAAADYVTMVDFWFDAEMTAFQQKQDELNAMVLMGIECGVSHDQANRINDAVDVVRWYQNQIPMRVLRALSALSDAADSRFRNDVQLRYGNTANGSAKVALIGIDRSVAAWGTLYEQFPEKADGILRILVRLQQFGAGIEGAFPEARDFIRPGFDPE